RGPCNRASSLPVAGSQRRTGSLERAQEASFLPSGEKVRDCTPSLCPCRVRSSFPVTGSHRRIDLSSYPAARAFPSGAQTSVRGVLFGLFSAKRSLRVATSQHRITLSTPPATSVLLSGE